MLPDVFDQLLAGHGLSPEGLTKVMTVERLHHLFLDQTVEGPDIGHHPGHRINGAMDRDETVPLATLIAVLHRRERVASRDAGDVEPGRRSHLGIQVFILVQSNRMERPDVFLRFQLGPEDTCQIFRRGNPAPRSRAYPGSNSYGRIPQAH